MKEKSILFSTPMVQAILDDKKTQTRRVIKPQPSKDEPNIRHCTIEGFQCAPPGEETWADTDEGESIQLKPQYEKGDILWVRETFGIFDDEGEYTYIYYKADEGNPQKSKYFGKWKPSIFMPRKAARLFLKVKSVRVERLQDITPYDACCEGILAELPESLQLEQAGLPPVIPEKWKAYSKEKLDETIRCVAKSEYMKRQLVLQTLVFKYQKLWDSLNAKRGYSWETNPWVFVYEFMRIK